MSEQVVFGAEVTRTRPHAPYKDMRKLSVLAPALLLASPALAQGDATQAVSSSAPTLEFRLAAESRFAGGEGFRARSGSTWEDWGSWTGLGLGIEPVGRLGGVEVRGRLLVPVRIETGYRPTPLVELSLSGRRGGVSYGRHRNEGASLAAKGARIQGLRGELRLGRVEVEFLQGETRSAREGRLDAETGEVLTWGRYRRAVSNLNVATALARGLSVEMSVSRGEDDPGSIVYGRHREENLAAGGEVQYEAGRSRVDVSLGASRTGTESLSSAPTRRTGLAWEAEGRTVVAGHKLQVETYSVDRGHESFAGVGRRADRRGFGVSDRFSVMARKVSLGLGYEQYGDNLDGLASLTTVTRKPWAKATIRANKSLPRLDLTARMTRKTMADENGMRDDATVTTTAALSRRFEVAESGRMEPEIGATYSRRRVGLGADEETRTLFAGTETRLGANEASVKVSWSQRNHEAAGLDRNAWLVEFRQDVSAGERLRFEGRERYETFGYENGARQNRLDLEASLAFQLVPRRISVSGNYRYRDSRLSGEELDDQTVVHGLFVAITATESVRLLGS